jgi:hypothetical protein
MNPASLVRPPLVFVVLAEAALVTGLGAVSWHVWQDRFGPAPAAVASLPPTPRPAVRSSRPPTSAAASPSPAPVSTPPPTPQPGPAPGLSTEPNFVSRMLVELNQVEGTFEDLEWRVTKLIVDGIQRYVEGVVMPSIEHSESGR